MDEVKYVALNKEGAESTPEQQADAQQAPVQPDGQQYQQTPAQPSAQQQQQTQPNGQQYQQQPNGQQYQQQNWQNGQGQSADYMGENQSYGQPQYTINNKGKAKDNNSTICLVLGVCSIVFSFIICIAGIPLGIVGLVYDKKARLTEAPNNMQSAGRVCSIIGLILSILFTVLIILIIILIAVEASTVGYDYYHF